MMSAIKSSILKRMDSTPTSVRVCAIKFVQKVVQVQTPGVIADPRVRQRCQSSRWGAGTDANRLLATRKE